MPTIDDYFGVFLKTEDIPEPTEVRIKEVKPQTIGDTDGEKEKLVVYFEGLEKGLVLNKVNAEAIAELTGARNYEMWNNFKICLYVDRNVMFGSRRVGGIRVKSPEKKEA